jgi:siroheme synthase (precorrin-2 oxidase/ferrochelatase)
LRRQLQSQFSPQYAGWIEHLGKARERLFRRDVDAEERRQLLHTIVSPENFERWRSRIGAQGEPVDET